MKLSIALAGLLAASAAVGCFSPKAETASPVVIHIDGAVERAGAQGWREDLSAFEALALAGPIHGEADLSRVELRRTVDGEPRSFVLDLARMQELGDSSANILVLAGDSIHVPRRSGTR